MQYHVNINIEVMEGGFILNYPVIKEEGGKMFLENTRQIFVAQRKLNQKVKEVLASLEEAGLCSK